MWSIIKDAGWPIFPLIISSMIVMALIIERFMSLQRAKILPSHVVDEILELYRSKNLNPNRIDDLAANSALEFIIAAGLRHILQQTTTTRESLKLAMEEAGVVVAHRLAQYLTTLGTLASAAPLMGLLGTVIGMIEIFGASPSGGGSANPQQLAHGISVALYNTAFGIIVALPALIAHRHFRATVDTLLIDLEQEANRFANAL
jgi:biopolymer transport protein ExbB